MRGTLLHKTINNEWLVVYEKEQVNNVPFLEAILLHPDTNTTDLEDLVEVEFEIQEHGNDGFFQWNVAVLKTTVKWKDILKNHVNGLIRLDNGHYMEILPWLEENFNAPTRKLKSNGK